MSKKAQHSSPTPDLGFETISPVRRALRQTIFNPLANHAPPGLLKWVLKTTKSQLAAANWADPGGWRSMVISYEGRCEKLSDKALVTLGAMPMALRNRKRLAAHLIAELISAWPEPKVHVLCLGAGPGQIILEALTRVKKGHATLVDLSSDAFEYGLSKAASLGLSDRVRYIQADVRDMHQYLHEPAHIIKMLGILEYLNDELIVTIARAAADLAPAGSAVVFNSLSHAHGTDRFFRRVFGLHMIHRQPQQVCALLEQAGFGDFQVHAEPLGVYHVIVGRKHG